MTDDLAARVAALEDRAAISDRIVLYAQALDRADWDLFRRCITDPISIDFRDSTEMEPRMWPADEWLAFAREALSGFEAKQHLSPNHLVDIDGDRAVATSALFAQHYLPGAPGGDTFVMRGWYTNVLVRQAGEWRISELKQHFNWGTGNQEIFATSRERYLAERSGGLRSVVERYFAAVDAKDPEQVAAFFDPDVAFRYANNAPAQSRDEVIGGLRFFWDAVTSSEHRVVAVHSVDGGAVAEIDADYVRHDGKTVNAPAVSIFEVGGNGRITGLRVFTDVGPVFA